MCNIKDYIAGYPARYLPYYFSYDNIYPNYQVAKNILMSHGELKKKWSWSVEWLHEELERGGGGGAGGRGGGPGQGGYQGGGGGNPAPHLQYYSNWSPPAGSNETAHGYFLERSHSAR